MKATVDRQMGRTGQPNARSAARSGPRPTSSTSRASAASGSIPGPACSPWDPSYPADSDLRYRVQLEYRFQPVVPLVGFLTGNGMGGSLPIRVENRSPVLVGYEGS